jgi:hypothetical protein
MANNQLILTTDQSVVAAWADEPTKYSVSDDVFRPSSGGACPR